MIAQRYPCVYTYNAQRLNMCLWIIRHTYCIYMNIYAPMTYVYIANGDIYIFLRMPIWTYFLLFCFINSIYGLILIHNLTLGCIFENVILFYTYIHIYLMMNFISCLVMGYPLDWHDFSPIYSSIVWFILQQLCMKLSTGIHVFL